MDCKYIHQNDIHERYLLDRLNKTEKLEYLQHIKTCKSCQSKLESEQELIQSIHHYGHNEMKSEISRQVTEVKAKESQISWDMILKVAAIFFFLIITPGLVYYYQSVETPQVSDQNLTDEMIYPKKPVEKDKTIMQDAPQASDYDKLEEKQINSGRGAGSIATKQTTINKLDSKPGINKAEEMDNLQGAEDSGPGNQKVNAGIKVQSEIKEPKPAMQSVSMSRKPKNTISKNKDDAKSENSKDLNKGISSPATQNSFPLMDVFQKPSKVYKQDEEIIKILSTTKSNKRESSLTKKYQNESYANDSSVIEVIDKSGRQNFDKNITDKSIILNYNLDNQSISVSLIPNIHETNFYLQQSLPESFFVTVKQDETSGITMEWFVNSEIYNEDPNNILLHLDDDKNLLVKIRDLNTYTINLNSDSTKAILLK